MKLSKTILGWIATVVILFAYVAGTIHSCNKHPNDSKAETFTPFAIYRGIEMFWHDDFPGVDWKQKVSDDVSISIQLLSAVKQPGTMAEANQQLDQLATQIQTYPAEKRREIARGVRMVLRYGDVWAYELSEYLISRDTLKTFSFSADAKALIDSIKNEYGMFEIDQMSALADSLIGNTENSLEERRILARRLKGHIDTDKTFDSRYFRKLFKEDL